MERINVEIPIIEIEIINIIRNELNPYKIETNKIIKKFTSFEDGIKYLSLLDKNKSTFGFHNGIGFIKLIINVYYKNKEYDFYRIDIDKSKEKGEIVLK
jgi:hypothetical protein